jgi:hypothetical protein
MPNILKIYFYLKSEKVNRKGESPVYARLWQEQNSITIATGQYISKERWDFTDKLSTALRIGKEKELRKSLDNFELEIKNIFYGSFFRGHDFSLTKLKNEFIGKKNKERNHCSIDSANQY